MKEKNKYEKLKLFEYMFCKYNSFYLRLKYFDYNFFNLVKICKYCLYILCAYTRAQ